LDEARHSSEKLSAGPTRVRREGSKRALTTFHLRRILDAPIELETGSITHPGARTFARAAGFAFVQKAPAGVFRRLASKGNPSSHAALQREAAGAGSVNARFGVRRVDRTRSGVGGSAGGVEVVQKTFPIAAFQRCP